MFHDGLNRRLVLGVLLLAMPLCMGCGDSTVGKVYGKITYVGKPAGGLEVEFNPEQPGRSSIGFTDQEGYYEMQYTLSTPGALIGKHKVRVKIPPESDITYRVPARYGAKTELVFEVQPGSNEFNIDMLE